MPGVEVSNSSPAYRGHDLDIYERVLVNGSAAVRGSSTSPEQSHHSSRNPDADSANPYVAPYLDPRVDSSSKSNNGVLARHIDGNLNGTTRHSSLKAHKPLPKRRFHSETPESLRFMFHVDGYSPASLPNGQVKHASLDESLGHVAEASQRGFSEETFMRPSQDLRRADSEPLQTGTVSHTPHTPTLLPTPPDLSTSLKTMLLKTPQMPKQPFFARLLLLQSLNRARLLQTTPPLVFRLIITIEVGHFSVRSLRWLRPEPSPFEQLRRTCQMKN